jgi:hypothetical protein
MARRNARARAHQRLDGDRQVERLGDDQRRLQRPSIGARDQPAHPAIRERRGHLARLAAALLGQRRIADAGIDAGPGEMDVEFGLAVTNQDHGDEERLVAGGFGTYVMTKALGAVALALDRPGWGR